MPPQFAMAAAPREPGKPAPPSGDPEAGAMSGNGRVVAVYGAHAAAEDAIQQLGKSGYDIRKLSIVVKDYHIEERVVGFYSAGDRIRHWGKSGLLWGCTFGLLYGAALYVIPEIGPGPPGGPLAAWIGAAAGGALTAGGLGAVAAGLYSLSLPRDSVLKFELAMETDDEFLLVAGGAEEAAAAREIIGAARAAGLGEHSSVRWDRAGVAL